MAKAKVKIIVGSVRTGRVGRTVADWVMTQAQQVPSPLAFELVDLKEVNLPFLDEPVPPRMSDDYVHEHTRQWSRMMQEADALIVVTPEYNYGYPPALKNAIDYLYNEWQGKPVGLVAYGGGNAENVVRQLREVMGIVGLQPLDEAVTISQIWQAIDEQGQVKPNNLHGNIATLVQKLEDALS